MPTYPYASSGALNQIITKLRSSFPEKVDASVLKKLGIAPNNESYIINTIRFLGIIDKEGARTESAHDLFLLPDKEFSAGFAVMAQGAYKNLFDLHSDLSWNLEKSKLVSFFRVEDKSTELVGTRQADTFIKLAEVCGKRNTASNGNAEVSNREVTKKDRTTRSRAKKEKSEVKTVLSGADKNQTKNNDLDSTVSLAVKIEVNLPATPDQGVYDAIFRSIRANLIGRG